MYFLQTKWVYAIFLTWHQYNIRGVSISTHSWLLLPFFLPTQCVFPLQRFSKWRGVMIRQLAVTGGDALFRADEWHWNIHDITKEIYSSKYRNTNMQAICQPNEWELRFCTALSFNLNWGLIRMRTPFYPIIKSENLLLFNLFQSFQL